MLISVRAIVDVLLLSTL
jgi:hypothetical protein